MSFRWLHSLCDSFSYAPILYYLSKQLSQSYLPQRDCLVNGTDSRTCANSVDPDQTAPRSSLIWADTVCTTPLSLWLRDQRIKLDCSISEPPKTVIGYGVPIFRILSVPSESDTWLFSRMPKTVFTASSKYYLRHALNATSKIFTSPRVLVLYLKMSHTPGNYVSE